MIANAEARKRATPLKAIRRKCLDCVGGQVREIRLCPCEHCALWPYRMGTRPGHSRAIQANDEARCEKLASRQGVFAPESNEGAAA